MTSIPHLLATNTIGGRRNTLPPGYTFYAKPTTWVVSTPVLDELGDPVLDDFGNPVLDWSVVDGMVDTIGESSITFATGDASDLMAATFSFDSDAVTLQADADEGGDIFFDSADSMAPIVRSGVEWYDLLNGSFCWIGPRGIAIYTVDMIAYQSRIQRVLGYYMPTQYLYDPDNNILIGPDGQQMEII